MNTHLSPVVGGSDDDNENYRQKNCDSFDPLHASGGVVTESCANVQQTSAKTFVPF